LRAGARELNLVAPRLGPHGPRIGIQHAGQAKIHAVTQDHDDRSEAHAKASIRLQVSELEAMLPNLKKQRQSSPLANDMYEAADDWRSAGNLILNADTRVNYQTRAFSEQCLLSDLRAALRAKPIEDQERYADLLRLGDQIVHALQSTPWPKDGHLGVLKILRQQFGFLIEDYGFSIVSEKPTGLRYSSGHVFLELEYASTSCLSCAFGSEKRPQTWFWIEDLLYLYKDNRYKLIPCKLSLNTAAEVESWFSKVTEIFQQYGHQLLADEPGIFEQLASAQSERDQEIARDNEGR
jgi:hypothetical protein